MKASLIVRHQVADYAAWRTVYDDVAELRDRHGCSAEQVLHDPEDANAVLVIHDFPTLQGAQDFLADPELRAAMARGGVAGEPRIELYERA
jgi:hypothetical protein